MHFLPPEFRDKASKLHKVTFYSNLEIVEVVSAVWICLQDHTTADKTADEVIKTDGRELYRKNHFEVKVAHDDKYDEEEADHLFVFDLGNNGTISDHTPRDILLQEEQKQQVRDYINANYGGNIDSAMAHFGDTKTLSEMLALTRKRAQQIIKERIESNQIDSFGRDNSGSDE